MSPHDKTLRAFRKSQLAQLRDAMHRATKRDVGTAKTAAAWSILGQLETLGDSPTNRELELFFAGRDVGYLHAENFGFAKLVNIGRGRRIAARKMNDKKSEKLEAKHQAFHAAYNAERQGRVSHTRAIREAEKKLRLGTGVGKRYAKALGLVAQKNFSDSVRKNTTNDHGESDVHTSHAQPA